MNQLKLNTTGKHGLIFSLFAFCNLLFPTLILAWRSGSCAWFKEGHVATLQEIVVIYFNKHDCLYLFKNRCIVLICAAYWWNIAFKKCNQAHDEEHIKHGMMMINQHQTISSDPLGINMLAVDI